MKTQWNDVSNKITLDDVGKEDWIYPISQIRMNGDGRIGIRGLQEGSQNQLGFSKQGMTPDDFALSQVSSRLGIPSRYAKKVMESEPKLLAQHFNHWIEKLDEDTEGDKAWLLRGKRDSLRGVLTNKYTQLDNNFVFDALSSSLQGGDVVDVKNFDLTSKNMNFRMVFPDLTYNLGTIQKVDNVMVGIHVINSEVGASSLRIESCLFRLVCTNGLIARVGGDSLMAQRHVHLTTREMENRVADAIDKALQVGDQLVDRFARSREITVTNPLATLEKLAKKQKYTNQFVDTLKSSFNSEPGDSVFEIVNAFTHASQTLPFDRRLEVETFAGKVMNDFLSKELNNTTQFLDEELF